MSYNLVWVELSQLSSVARNVIQRFISPADIDDDKGYILVKPRTRLLIVLQSTAQKSIAELNTGRFPIFGYCKLLEFPNTVSEIHDFKVSPRLGIARGFFRNILAKLINVPIWIAVPVKSEYRDEMLFTLASLEFRHPAFSNRTPNLAEIEKSITMIYDSTRMLSYPMLTYSIVKAATIHK